MKIVVFGAGYVGLTAAVCLSSLGHDVVAIDIDAERVRRLTAGECPLREPGLEELQAACIRAGRLSFDTAPTAHLADAELCFICVDTPTDRQTNEVNMTAFNRVAGAIIGAASDDLVVVIKSTVPLGTFARLQQRFDRSGVRLHAACNPEFLREGSAVEDFLKPHRIVVGVADDLAAQRLKAAYAPLIGAGVPYLEMAPASAELVKYASNAFLATKITFINEIANLSELTSGNIDDIVAGMGLDPRISPHAMRAGPGYGGSCFPKDTLALANAAQDLASPLRILEAVIASNDDRMRLMVNRVVRLCGGDVEGKTIAVWGLAFKANTDDFRDSAAIPIIRALLQKGARVRAYDPMVDYGRFRTVLDIELADSPEACAEDADCIAVLTEWDAFAAIDWARLASRVASRTIFDARNVVDRARLPDDWDYECVGKPGSGKRGR